MIARAIQQGAAGVVGEIAQLQHVVAEGFERLHGAREFAELAFVIDRRIPVAHHDAVGHVKEREAHW